MILLNTPEIVALSKFARGHALDSADGAAMDRLLGKAIATHALLNIMAGAATRNARLNPKEPA